MKDQAKTKAQLIQELIELRREVHNVKTAEIDCIRGEREGKTPPACLHKIMNAVDDPIICISTDYKVKLMNRAAREIAPVKQVTERLNCYEVFHDRDTPCDGSANLCPLEQVRESLQPVTVVHEHIQRDGTKYTVEINASPLVGKDGSLTGVVESIRDITERVRAEERLRLLSSAVEQSTEGIAMSDLDGNLTFVNRAFAAMHGYSPEELIGVHLSIFHNDEQIPSVEAANKQIRERGAFSGEIWHVRRDGTVFPTLMNNSLLRDGANNPIGMIGTIREITDRVLVEDALRESEEKYRLLVEHSSTAITVVDKTGTVLLVNAQGASNLNGTPDAFVGKPIQDLFPDRADELIERNRQVIESGVGHDFEDVFELPSGRRWFFSSIQPIKDLHGKTFAVQIISQDITERKEAEEALREAEERFRTVFENTMIGLYRTTPAGRIFMVNPALVRMLGYSSFEELSQRNLEETGFEPEYQRLMFKRRMEKEGQVIGLESAWKTRDGETLFIRESARTIKDEAGTILYYEGTVEDITDRKRAEEALQRLKDELELRVKKRTTDLNTSNVKLRREISGRKRVEESLRKSEKKLSKQNILLQKKNIALREMTEQLKAEKERIESQLVANVDRFLLPLVAKLRKETSSIDRSYINLLEENMKELISSFGNEISRKMHSLTPKEIEICYMIRGGMTSKEIAGLTHSSHRTVERHRNNIRKKLDLTKKNINLTTYLQSI